MADNTKIEWTDATWNPITGCSVVSPGCTNCYAMKLAGGRLKNVASRKGLTRATKAGPVWTGEVRFNEAELLKPLSWRRPRKIFPCAHGDLFHEKVKTAWIVRTFAIMALCPQHLFQVLTKRSERMRKLLSDPQFEAFVAQAMIEMAPLGLHLKNAPIISMRGDPPKVSNWPLPNVWLGVSAEDQPRLEERVVDLAQTPAAIRWLSAEPLLGALDLTRVSTLRFRGAEVFNALTGTLSGMLGDHCPTRLPALDWVVVGGESGPGARDLLMANLWGVAHQCWLHRTPLFVKQLGSRVIDRNDAGFDGDDSTSWPDIDPDCVEHDLSGFRDGYQGAPVRIRLRSRKGGDMSEWPQDLRCQQMPEPR